jgi:hypothetical protein
MRIPRLIWSSALVWLLSCGAASAAVTLTISASPGTNSPGLGRIALSASTSAVTVVITPAGSMSITSGNGVFLPGAGTSGTASPTVSTVTASCSGGAACGTTNYTVTVAQSGNTGNTATLSNFTASATAANCTKCTFGATGTSVPVPLTIVGGGKNQWTAVFTLGMTVNFSAVSAGTGATSVSYTISVN